MTRAALYARCSTDDQVERDASIPDQLAACRSAAIAAGHEVALEADDPGVSGSVWPRPGLARVLAAADRGEISALWLWDYSRLARDDELHGHLRWLLRAAGVEIRTVCDPGARPLEIGLHAIVAAEQRRATIQSITRGMRSKASRREYTGGRRLYGYRWTGKTTREIVPEEAAVVARVFEMADPAGEYRGLSEISRELGMQLQWVRRMLRHPGYAGAYTYSRHTLVRSHGPRASMIARPAPPDRVVISWGAHEPIVPRDRWDRVQARLDAQAAQRPHNTGQASLPLSGLLRCGICGNPLRVSGAYTPPDGSALRYYYRCRTAGCPGVGVACVAGWTAEIMRAVAEQLREPTLARAIVAELRRAYSAGRRTGSWEAEVRRLEKAEASIRGVIASGEVADTRALAREYQATQRSLDRARASLAHERRRSGAQVSVASIRERLAHARALLEAIRDPTEADRAARPVLQHLVESVTVPAIGPATVEFSREVTGTEESPASDGHEIRVFSFPVRLPGRERAA